MTVAALPASIDYIEDGSTTSFAVPFRFNAPGDLRPVRYFANGSSAPLVPTTDFTATGGSTDAGGTLTVVAAAVAGTRLRITRSTTRSQQTTYTSGDRFPAVMTEQTFDRAMLIDQEQDVALADIGSRAVQVPVGEAVVALPSAAARAGKLLAFGPVGAGAQPLAFPVDAATLNLIAANMSAITAVYNYLSGPLVVQPVTLPAMTAGAAFSQALAVTNGLTPYAFSVSSGSLPAGLTMGDAGIIVGTPTTPSAYSFRVTAVDASGKTGVRNYIGSVKPLAAVPASARVLVDFANYQASPRPCVANERAANQSLSANVFQYPRLHFQNFAKGGDATVSAAYEGDAARVTWGSGGTGQVYDNAGVNGPAGYYTLVYTLKAVSGSPQVVLHSGFGGATSTVTLTNAYVRYSITTAAGATNPAPFVSAGVGAADFLWLEANVIPGQVDTGGNTQDHLYLGGIDGYHALPTITNGAADLAGTQATRSGLIQFSAPFKNDSFTVSMLIKKTTTQSYTLDNDPLGLAGYQALFSPDLAGSAGFGIVVGGNVTYVGHTGRSSQNFAPFTGQPYERFGLGYQAITLRYDAVTKRASIFVGEIELFAQVNGPTPTLTAVREMILNFQQSTESLAMFAAEDRAWTNAEIRGAVNLWKTRNAARSSPLALDGTNNFCVFEGDSNTDGLIFAAGSAGSWPYLFKANAAAPYHGAVYATAGATLATLEAREGAINSIPYAPSGCSFTFAGFLSGNDGPGFSSTDSTAYLTRLRAYLQRKKDAGFNKIIWGTMLNRKDSGATQPAFDTWRQAINTGIRGMLGNEITHLADIASSTLIGQTNSPDNAAYFNTGSSEPVHLIGAGQAEVLSFFQPQLNA